jgi:spore coat protein U-like protein
MTIFRESAMKSVCFIAVLFLAALACTGPATACTLLNLYPVGFGDSDGSSDTGPRKVADVQLQCGEEYRLGLDGGLNLSGTRRLSDGSGHFIGYRLWRDSGNNLEWGDNGLGSGVPYLADPMTGTGTGSVETIHVYGTANTKDAFPSGSYTDLVHVVLAYPPYGPGDRLEGDLFVSLTLTGACTLDTSGVNGFGAWPAGSSDLQGVALGVITVSCTTGLNFAVGMDAGQNWQSGSRHMSDGAELVAYTLWADSSRSTPWGDSGLAAVDPDYTETHPAPAQTGVATGPPANFFIWGDAAIGGHSPGTYIDTVTVTVSWP